MRFKVDENLPPFVAARLRTVGFDAVTVADQSLSGTKDETLAPSCADEGRILVTLDLDFADIRAHPPGTTPGFVVLRLDAQDRSDIEPVTDPEAVRKILACIGLPARPPPVAPAREREQAELGFEG